MRILLKGSAKRAPLEGIYTGSRGVSGLRFGGKVEGREGLWGLGFRGLGV